MKIKNDQLILIGLIVLGIYVFMQQQPPPPKKEGKLVPIERKVDEVSSFSTGVLVLGIVCLVIFFLVILWFGMRRTGYGDRASAMVAAALARLRYSRPNKYYDTNFTFKDGYDTTPYEPLGFQNSDAPSYYSGTTTYTPSTPASNPLYTGEPLSKSNADLEDDVQSLKTAVSRIQTSVSNMKDNVHDLADDVQDNQDKINENQNTMMYIKGILQEAPAAMTQDQFNTIGLYSGGSQDAIKARKELADYMSMRPRDLNQALLNLQKTWRPKL